MKLNLTQPVILETYSRYKVVVFPKDSQKPAHDPFYTVVSDQIAKPRERAQWNALSQYGKKFFPGDMKRVSEGYVARIISVTPLEQEKMVEEPKLLCKSCGRDISTIGSGPLGDTCRECNPD